MPGSADQLLFAYGTLLRPTTQLDVFGRLVHADDDILPGYALRYCDGEDPRAADPTAHTVLPLLRPTGSELDKVPGQLLHLSPDELDAADEFQVPLYRRARVTVASGRRAWLYLRRPEATA
ncbi:gamma-glutamylcyclotransferase family protein [Microbacterium sp. cx-59]|uniref:gamma-glutamylcyclotransferase family protein n=1 Tax=Microbacterium sp. cx-59 TaxID=2891207 RepID=UPI001E3AF1A3|nr:gamma-glutamylcyclotransferase family protein [Microbacterium sp. cx-59]MCC4906688.1 gamma-glutamylcyclotransferase [Microbacterium sp. cx-59]